MGRGRLSGARLGRPRLGGPRLSAAATLANVTRNGRAPRDRHRRWAVMRARAWACLEPLVTSEMRVAVVGAGNGDTLPLETIAAGAGELTLLDVDGFALGAARRRLPRALRGHVRLVEDDVTEGAADSLAARAAGVGSEDGATPGPDEPPSPLPGAPYDLVIGDLFYSQLLYPALRDLEMSPEQCGLFLAAHGAALTRRVVARLHASAPTGSVLHLHDPVAWWPGHAQPFSLDRVLAIAEADPHAALRLIRSGRGPQESDPRAALTQLDVPELWTRLWPWPFADGVDYLVAATLAGPRGEPPAA